MATTSAPAPRATEAQIAAVQAANDRNMANGFYQASTGDFLHRPVEPGRALRMPWKAKDLEAYLRDGKAGTSENKGGMEKERVVKVLGEYIKDKRDSMRMTGHIDKKLTALERSVADLGLHEQFDAARKNDGKLGNGPLMADEGRHPDAGLTKSDV